MRYIAVLSTFYMGRKIEIPAITDAKDGFWINAENKFTRDEDADVWVPPAQVISVVKQDP